MKRLLRYEEQVIQREIDQASQNRSAAPERRQISIRDQQALLHLDIRDVLTDAIEVVDGPERPPR